MGRAKIALATAALATAGCDGPPDAVELPALCAPRGPTVDWFVERAADAGLRFDFQPLDFRGGAIAVADLDGDDRLDIVAGSRAGGLAAFHNLGDQQFVDQTDALGLRLFDRVDFIAPADLDGDGDIDLALTTDRGLRLFERTGAGFVVRAAPPSSTAIEHLLPVDLDGDGDLDLFATSHDRDGDPARAHQLFLNQGELSFAAWEWPAGGLGTPLGWAATALDHDGDGDVDLYVANDNLVADFGDGRIVGGGDLPVDSLFDGAIAETGALGFHDRAAELGLTAPRSSMGGLLADLDGDGALDLHVTDFGADKLFVIEPDGFRDRAAELGLAAPHRTDGGCARDRRSLDCLLLSWGDQAGDFDLDGHDDLIVANGVSLTDGEPPPQLVFRGPPPFHEVDAGLGCFEGHGLIAADLDDDGDLDLVVSTRSGPLRLFDNRASRLGEALSIDLIGQRSNRQGLGAVVEVELDGGRRIVRAVGAGGAVHAAPPARIHVGLGRERVRRVVVRWPSGVVQEVAPVSGGHLVVREP